MGLPHQLMMERHHSILVVRRIEVEYWRPARLDDAIVVETRVLAVRGVTLVLDQRMVRPGEEGQPLAALRAGEFSFGTSGEDTFGAYTNARPRASPALHEAL